MITYTVSARKKNGSIQDFLARHYKPMLGSIDSVFGFTEYSSLYGGRPYWGAELTGGDIHELYDMGIGYRIPLTTHLVTQKELTENKAFFEKYHRDGNTIICTNDDLAVWIREYFPKYKIEASAIKKIETLTQINKDLEIYDTLVLPADQNANTDLLTQIKDKSRIRLFSRAGCALTCKHRICYKSFSKFNKKLEGELLCSMTIKPRDSLGVIDMDIQPLIEMGFTKFKAVPN